LISNNITRVPKVVKSHPLAFLKDICEAGIVKGKLVIFLFYIVGFFSFLLLLPGYNSASAQGDCGPCEAGYSCQPLYEDQGIYECQPSLQQGNKCNTAENQCAGNQSCIPDAPGSDTGTCKAPDEGSLCNPANTQSCGASTTTPFVCKQNADGSHTCQRPTCNPANNHAECKDRPSFFCIPEADGKAYCKFSTISPDDWCDRLEVGTPCYQEDPNRPTKWCVADPGGGQPTCKVLKNPPPLPTSPNSPCAKGQYDAASGRCKAFTSGLGNFATDASEFLRNVFGILLAFSGGIALLLIIRAGYKIMTSRGNQDAIKEGREQLIAAIVGLLFLIFSFVFLEVIGVDLLRLPGFGGAATAPPAKLPKGADCLVGNNQCGSGLVCRDTKQPTQINNSPGKCLEP
jgi:hypothetical protein